MTTGVVIVLGILTWVVMSIPLAFFVAGVSQRSRRWAPAVELSLEPSVGKPVFDPAAETQPVFSPAAEVMTRFPGAPMRFVGRAEVMAAAAAALAPVSGRTAVVFHGMAGVGKTTCAVELAYRHEREFGALAFWSAPSDPDQFGDALRLLAVALDVQLGDYGFAMVEEIATQQRLEHFLPTLTTVFADAGLLLVLDNLDILLTPDGQWRDSRWAPLIGALTEHSGPSRVTMASRIVPVGLNPDTVLIQPVHALSRDESLWLIRRLPNLRALLHTVLGRGVLTLAQGHPQLMELADAAAADPHRLAYQLADIEAAVDGTAVAAFVTEGETRLDAEQLMHICTAWTVAVAVTLPIPARLLLQALCRAEETDRSRAVAGANWPALWRRLNQPGEPPPLASLVAALVGAALIVADPIEELADQNEPVRYRIHPSVAEAIHAVTPEPVIAAVDAQLAAWWTAVAGGWGIELRQTGKNPSQFRVWASLAAARYLLRQHDWDAASCLLERALIQQGYSTVTSLAAIALLRRIAEATGSLKDLVVLGAAVRRVDSAEAEILLRRAYDQATTDGKYPLASTTAGELVTLLRDQGRLGEALTLADQKIEHSRQAGFGSWTQLSDQGRRLQILNLLGHHEQVLLNVPALRARMTELPDQRANNDRVNPWNAREGVLDTGRLSAVALKRWDEALELNDEIASTQRRRGASPQEIAHTRFNNYIPLLHLGRLADADQLLRDCQEAFNATGDITQLAVVYGARADLEDKRDHPAEAVDLQRTSLRLWYVHPNPHEISTAHHNLANYLSRTTGNPAEQHAHLLTASLLDHLTGNTRDLTKTLLARARELPPDTSDPNTPALPTTLPEITHLVDADDGIHFANLVSTLCPATTTAERALADLLATRETDPASRNVMNQAATIPAGQAPLTTKQPQAPR